GTAGPLTLNPGSLQLCAQRGASPQPAVTAGAPLLLFSPAHRQASESTKPARDGAGSRVAGGRATSHLTNGSPESTTRRRAEQRTERRAPRKGSRERHREEGGEAASHPRRPGRHPLAPA